MCHAASARTAVARSCIALLAAAWPLAGMAGVEAQQAATQGEAAPAIQVITDRPGTVKEPHKAVGRNKGRTLRCWQYGRLIFEEAVSSLPPSLAGQGQVFQGKSGKQTIQLLDIHTATCMLK